MCRSWLVLVLVVTLGVSVAAWLLSGSQGPSAAAQEDRQVLLRQADDIRAFARATCAPHWSDWASDYVDRYADAVRAGILMGTDQPLSEAKMADLRTAIEQQAKGATPGPEVCLETRIAQTKFIYAAIAARPKPSPKEEQEIITQIQELGEFLEEQIQELVTKPIAKRLREQGHDISLPPGIPAQARARFEEKARSLRQQPFCFAFKSPLSTEELQGIRRKFRDLAHQSSSIAALDIMLRGMGAERCYRFKALKEMPGTLFAVIPDREPHYPPEVQQLRQKCNEAQLLWIRASLELPRVQGSMLLLNQALLLQSEGQGQRVPYP